MRQQRTHLQHEVDILTQSLNQELLTLNDAVRGLFNDRNMAVREEQKSVESAVSLSVGAILDHVNNLQSDPKNQLQDEYSAQQR